MKPLNDVNHFPGVAAMKTVKHTSGPWRTSVDKTHILGGRDYCTSVCQTFGYQRREQLDNAVQKGSVATDWLDDMVQEDLANAKLIAASPDLLDACETFVRLCDNALRNAGKEGYWHDEAYNAAKAAIEKATQ